MRYVSDDRALRVEEIATELPGEMPWRIWVRAFVAFWPTSAVICSGLWAVGTALGAGPWWLIVALLCGVTAAATTVLAVLGWISRYETPQTPLRYLWRTVIAEASAPRPTDTTAVGAPPIPVATGPTRYGSQVAAPTSFRRLCDYPICTRDGVAG